MAAQSVVESISGLFNERHCEKSGQSTSVESTYTCHKCLDGKKLAEVESRKGMSYSSKRKTPSEELHTLNSGKSKMMENDENKTEQSEEIEEVALAVPLRRSARSSERFTLLMLSMKAETRTRQKAKPLNILQKKRKAVDSSYWFNGIQLSKRTSDGRLMHFRSSMHLVLSGDDTSIRAKCSLCREQQHNSTLNYVACEVCRVWFHVDALGLGAEKIVNIIGFKCHRCLHKKPPNCPHHCPS